METKIKALVDDFDQFIGIDHHKSTTYITIKDRQGEVIKKGNINTSKDQLARFLNNADGEESKRRMAVLECGRTYRPMWRWLSGEVDEVILAHPGGLKVISETVYKDDKIDSGKLADLLMLGMIPEAHAASDEAWIKRQTLRHRMMLVKMQTQTKNRVHVIVDLYPDATPAKPRVTDMFGKMGFTWLESLELPGPDRRRLDESCRHLMTIPGIGPFFSTLIASEVDGIDRFPKCKEFVSYTGLVPRRDDSGEKEKGGKIHKQGNKYLRWALVEAAIPATRSNLALKNLYDRIHTRKGKKKGHNVAKVAVARKLAEITYRILKDGRPYEIRY